ncbi:MAG: hypothetical protein ACI8RZ_007048 [Myxococcota bacterium]|jgi:hypothetical protein
MLMLLLACFDSDPQPEVPAPQLEAPAIDGAWTFAEECGENTGGTPVAVYYSLTITGQTATLHADGYQTMTRITGDLTPTADNTWTLSFAAAEPDSMFPDAYDRGAPLLTLTHAGETLQGHPLGLGLNCSEGMVFTR